MPSIEKLLFRENSVLVELDNSERLVVSYAVYSEYKISSGMELSSELYMELYDESKRFECMERAMGQLAVRARSMGELKLYLKKKNFSEMHIEVTLERLKERGYLNDYDFSMSFIREKVRGGRHGKELIKRDLHRKGVNRKTIDRAMKASGADRTDEDLLLQLALKKYNSVKDKENSLMKVSSFLRSRGFDFESINRVLRRINPDLDE